ncbi:hypothetical protein RJP21_18040 [Paenibacillus sp. VCA1]|uniref:hypothetical protein n=1 Tax=Paenibacillus sp. VCA1 TaxID=3039148 RepID=UPI002870CB1A|nr:hypothetical protein [Paenibacillus sp. VCA1]MDR9855517.1 hypothetical protein [Paenibacillus sp. VCA1]
MEHVLDLIALPAIRMRYEANLNFNGSVNYKGYVTAQCQNVMSSFLKIIVLTENISSKSTRSSLPPWQLLLKLLGRNCGSNGFALLQRTELLFSKSVSGYRPNSLNMVYWQRKKIRGCFTDGESLEIVCDFFHSCEANIGEALLCMGRNDY